jgi:quinol monooxygenase YgiN
MPRLERDYCAITLTGWLAGWLEWSNTMIVEYIRYTVADQGRGDELQRAYAIAANQLDAAPECLAYELAQCEEDAKSWTLRIEWRSTDAHLQLFRKGPYFPAFLEPIREFMPEIAEMRHYRLTDVQSRKPAQP